MVDKRLSLVMAKSIAANVTLVALLVITVHTSLSCGQSTHMDYDQISSTETLADLMNNLKESVSSCATSRREINTGFREINGTISKILMSSFSNHQSHVVRSTNELGSYQGCNCSTENSFHSEIRDKLMELSRDVTFIKSREERTEPRNASTTGDCIVDIRSSGCNDGSFKGSHIRVNWTNVHYSDKPGIYLAIVDPVACTGTPFPIVYPAGVGVEAAQILVSYINLLTVGQIVAGATYHEPHANLGVATAALDGLGVKSLNILNSCGKFAFVAQKGNPLKTVSSVKRNVDGNLWLVVKMTAGTYPSDVTFTRLNNP